MKIEKTKSKSNSGVMLDLAFKRVFSPEEIAKLAAGSGTVELLFKVACTRNPGEVKTQLIAEVAP